MQGIHTKELDIPIERVWGFVSDMNKWAPIVPGYLEHEIINDRQSTWKIKGDIGILQKTVHLQIDIIEWEEPTKVTFNIQGLNENFVGDGYFLAEQLANQKTRMTGNIKITAKGMMGPMINSILKSVLPKASRYLTEVVSRKIMEEDLVIKY